MAPPRLFDIAGIDLERVQFGVDEIERVNPHRGAMRLIDGIIHLNEEATRAIAFKDVRDDEFWVHGHIPGRPLMPGVLMIEAAAQLASFCCLKRLPDQPFMGFAGLDKVKFRGQVVPGDRLIIIEDQVEFRKRRFIGNSQGSVGDRLVFEGLITGMLM